MNQLPVIMLFALAKGGPLWTFIFTILPFAIVCGFLAYLFNYSQKQYRKYLERSVEHMDALEEKTDRVIELLEQINRRKE